MAVTHHELCFGCGHANLFGLQLEADPDGEGSLAGRFFLKQDHQGPYGTAHVGLLAAGLEEAMSLALRAAGVHAVARRIEVQVFAPVPVGTFVRVEAAIEERAAVEGVEQLRVSTTAFGASREASPQSPGATGGEEPDPGGERGLSTGGGERRRLAQGRGLFVEAERGSRF